RRASALLPVAGDTATDDVLPVLAATLCDRHDVVERQLAARERFAAVLTAVIVSGVDVGAREGHVVESALDADAAEQTDHRGELERKGHTPDLPVFVD